MQCLGKENLLPVFLHLSQIQPGFNQVTSKMRTSTLPTELPLLVVDVLQINYTITSHFVPWPFQRTALLGAVLSIQLTLIVPDKNVNSVISDAELICLKI